MKRYTIPVKCQSSNCRHYKKCPQIKSEIYEKKGKVHVCFIGQGGGEEEEETGLPFKGKAGKELRKDLKQIKEEFDVSFGSAFTNTTRNHPTASNGKNRTPERDEVENCLIYLERDIEKIQPEILVPLGAHTTNIILPDVRETITKIAGKVFKTNFAGKEYTVVPNLHPSYVIQNGRETSILNTFIKGLKTAIGQSSVGNKIKNKNIRFSQKGKSVLLDDFKKAKKYLKFLLDYKGKYVALDTEGKNLNRKYDNKITTFQFATDTEVGYVLPWRCKGSTWTAEQFLILKKLLKRLFFEKRNFKYWIIQNAKYDGGQILREFGGFINSALIYDTMVGAYLLNETKLEKGERKGAYSLEKLAIEELEFGFYETSGMKEERGNLWKMDVHEKKFYEYAAADAYVIARLFIVQTEKAKEQNYVKNMKKMMFHFYDPVLKLLSFMEWGGIKIDTKQLIYLMDSDSVIVKRIKEIEKWFKNNKYAIKANKSLIDQKYKMKPRFPIWLFDLNKNKHLHHLFFDIMEVEPVGEPGKSGDHTVGKAFQEEYEESLEEVKLFSEYKKLFKLVSSYMNQIYKFLGSEYIDHKDGRIRPNFGLTVTTTGRGNCVKPNLQQIPRGRNPAQKEIKNMFAPDENNLYVILDYATNEVRWLALLSRDEKFCSSFIKAFAYRKKLMVAKEKGDIEKYKKLYVKFNDTHKQVATLMNNVPFEKVDEEMRQGAKGINFGLIFGMGARSLCIRLGKDPDSKKDMKYVKNLISIWFSTFPDGKKYLDDCVKLARKIGYVESPLGRRRRLRYIHSKNDKLRNHSENQAKNSPIQGVASDATFLSSSLLLHEYIIPKKKLWRIPAIIHDSCILEIPRVKSELKEALKIMDYFFTKRIIEYIETNMDFKFMCPLDIDLAISQKSKKGRGDYGYGTSSKWDWTQAGLKKLNKNIDFMSIDEWYKKENIDIHSHNTIIKTYQYA